tara:strand:+ start:274 stop:387 length:114 start_codon:yes stop_codon:yes gene_type:complete
MAAFAKGGNWGKEIQYQVHFAQTNRHWCAPFLILASY